MSDYERIKNTCLQTGQLWEDPDFPAVQTSTFYHQTPPFNFQWLRAKEIYVNPKFRHEDTENFDVVSGKLGDAWLVSCLGVLYLNKGLMYRVVPGNQDVDSEYCGMFRFRLWWCGQWVEVLVDDRLPTVYGSLVFIQSACSEQLWPALLEKAYAKLHGSYEALKYGTLLDGLSALTGGITEMIPMANVTTNLLKTALANSSIVTAYLKDNMEDKIRLQCDMNYKVTSVEEIETYNGGTMTVVCLRRPLAPGETEVTSVLLNSSQMRNIPPYERERITTPNRGFWIPFYDFLKLFNKLEMVHLDAESCTSDSSLEHKNKWKMQIFHGFWRRGVNAGGCRNYSYFFHNNPQIQLHLSEPDTVVISLCQHIVMEPKVIGYSIYKLIQPLVESATPALFKAVKSSINSQYTNSRQVTHRWHLEAGVYLVMPTTFEPREEARFSLRIFSLKDLKMDILDVEARVTKSAVTHAPVRIDTSTFAQYEAVFLQLSDEHKTIDTFELQELLEACLPNDYIKSCASVDTCRQIVLSLDKKGNGRIPLSAFKDLMCSLKDWQIVFKNHAREKMGVLRAERLRDALREVGFCLPQKAMFYLVVRYMRKDGMLRFGDFVSVVMHLYRAFSTHNVNAVPNVMRMTLSQWLIHTLSC